MPRHSIFTEFDLRNATPRGSAASERRNPNLGWFNSTLANAAMLKDREAISLSHGRRHPGAALDTEGHRLPHGFTIDGVAFQHEIGVLFRHRVPLHCNSNSEGRKLVTLTL